MEKFTIGKIDVISVHEAELTNSLNYGKQEKRDATVFSFAIELTQYHIRVYLLHRK